MATIYNFKFTDESKPGFTVVPYTSNGTLTPTNGTTIPNAAGANTSLKLYGKGQQDYGEGVEQNLIYILENFANDTAVINPIEGQLWYAKNQGSPPTSTELLIYNDIDWSTKILLNIGTSKKLGPLDMSGYIITDIANAINPSDALNTQTADTLYLNIGGDGTVGDLTVTGILTTNEIISTDNISLVTGIGSPTTPNTPTNPEHVINIQYADNNYVNISGDTMVGPLLLRPNIGSPPIDVLEAASIEYVNTSIGGGPDSFLTNVSFQTNSGSATIPNISGSPPVLQDDAILFTINNGQPSIEIAGVSFTGHTHIADDISYDNSLNGNYPSLVQGAIDYIETNKANLVNPVFTGNLTVTGKGSFGDTVSGIAPVVGNDLATKDYVDNITIIPSNIKREMIIVPAGSPIDTWYQVFDYFAGLNALSISVNGQVQYANTRSIQTVSYNIDISDNTLTGLDLTSPLLIYDFTITTDFVSTTYVINPLTDIVTTHRNLVDSINSKISSALNDATFNILGKDNKEGFSSNTIGSSSSILISDPGIGSPNYTYLFSPGVINGLISVDTAQPGLDFDYTEGILVSSPDVFIKSRYNSSATHIDFNTGFVPGTGNFIEVLLR